MSSTTFLLATAVLVATALLILLIPLLRRPALRTTELRAQLDRLQEAHGAGLIDDATFAERKAALSAEALAIVDGSAQQPRSKLALALAIALAASIPFATYALYQKIGNPNALAFAGVTQTPPSAAANGAPDANAAPDLAAAADTLAARLKNNPDDGEGWLLLARTYRQIERFADARDAFERANKLLPVSADLLSEYAEALGLASEPRALFGEPEKLLDQALAMDGEHQRALWLKGFARRQDGDAAGADAAWTKLLGGMEPGSPVHTAVVEQLNQVRSELGQPGVTAATPASSAPAPAPSAAPAPSDSSAAPGIDVDVSLDAALADKAAPGDVLFVFARAQAGPPVPLAIARLSAGQLPTRVRLDTSMGMVAGVSLEQFPTVVIGARISKSGNAQASPGDLEGFSEAVEWRSAGTVSVDIDQIRP